MPSDNKKNDNVENSSAQKSGHSSGSVVNNQKKEYRGKKNSENEQSNNGRDKNKPRGRNGPRGPGRGRGGRKGRGHGRPHAGPRPCRFFTQKNNCRFGDMCKFLHVKADEKPQTQQQPQEQKEDTPVTSAQTEAPTKSNQPAPQQVPQQQQQQQPQAVAPVPQQVYLPGMNGQQDWSKGAYVMLPQPGNAAPQPAFIPPHVLEQYAKQALLQGFAPQQVLQQQQQQQVQQPQPQQPQQPVQQVQQPTGRPAESAVEPARAAPQQNGHHHPRTQNGHGKKIPADADEYNRHDPKYQKPAAAENQTKFSANDIRSEMSRSKPSNGRNKYARKVKARDPAAEAALFGERKTGINFDSYDDIPVETSGRDVPEAIQRFQDVELPQFLYENLELMSWDKPTPVQKQALPIGMARRDIMGCAQTGSGKTAAFLFPYIGMLASGDLPHVPGSSGRFRRRVSPSGLILAPTRELATQIYDQAIKFCYRSDIRPVVVYGGQNIHNQMRELERGCDLLVATPGRLVDFVQRGRISLAQVTYLVFDEADRMLDMGFEPQIRQIVEQSDMNQKSRQTLMFSATFPKEIQRLAQDFLGDYVFISIGRVGSSSELIKQRVEYVEDADKREHLMHILPKCTGLTLIFVERKRQADMLEDWLTRNGVNATSIHGDRTQDEREEALAVFRCGRCPVLVATDVAARGLDIPDVMDVINFDMPNQIEDYVHRIGRTGRCGHTGNAVAFINERNRSVIRDLYTILRENNQELPSWFEEMVDSASRGSGMRRASGRGRQKFGARDMRSKEDILRKKGGDKKNAAKPKKANDGWGVAMGGPRHNFGGSSGLTGNDAW